MFTLDPCRGMAPWSKVLLEKLTVAQLLKKFPVFYGTRRSVTGNIVFI
jgi:hypothetical protein